MDFPFYDAPNTATIVCCHVMDKESPILYVSHDEEDGMWQFLCGKPHDEAEARIVSLKFAFEIDNSVGELKDMPWVIMQQGKAKKVIGLSKKADEFINKSFKGEKVYEFANYSQTKCDPRL